MDRDADGVKDAKTEGVSEQTSGERVEEDDGSVSRRARRSGLPDAFS